MHILFVTENFPPELNAASARVHERAVYWVKSGHKVTIITQAPNFPMGKLFDGYENKCYQKEIIDGINVIRVKTLIFQNKGTIRRLMDFISFMFTGSLGGLTVSKPDVVIATSPQFFTAIAGWFIAKVKRKPFIFELGDLWPASVIAVGAMKKNIMLEWVERVELFLYYQSSAVIALTSAFKRNLVARGIPEEKISVVINGVDLPRYSPRLKDEELLEKYNLKDKFVVGYIGTNGMAHGLVNVLNTAELMQDNDSIRFVIMGPGAEREMLIEDARRRNLNNVIFIEPAPKSEIPRYWSLLDVALINLRNYPIFKTVIPSKTFEAMAMGLPLVLSLPKGEITRIVIKDQAGICVPPEDAESLAEAVLKLKNDPELYNRLKKNSTDAAKLHSREYQANQVLNVALEVAKK